MGYSAKMRPQRCVRSLSLLSRPQHWIARTTARRPAMNAQKMCNIVKRLYRRRRQTVPGLGVRKSHALCRLHSVSSTNSPFSLPLFAVCGTGLCLYCMRCVECYFMNYIRIYYSQFCRWIFAPCMSLAHNSYFPFSCTIIAFDKSSSHTSPSFAPMHIKKR